FAIRSSALPYYFKYNLGREALGSMTLLATVLQLATTVLIPFFAYRIGKRNTMMIGMLGTIVSQFAMYFSEQMGGNVTMIIT
ncbi:MFS transporter, partial [Enterobacter hormaechei]